MAGFVIGVLGRDQVRAVYPLIRQAVPTLELSAWLRFARQLTGVRRADQCGIVAARREGRAFPCGLFCYRIEVDLRRGRTLIADHFVALDLLDPGAVVAALVEALEELAARLDCQAVRSVVHGGTPGVADELRAAGHRPEAELLLKELLQQQPRRRRELHEPQAPFVA